MTALHRLSLPFLTLGVLILATAAAWWWITYSDVIHYHYIGPGEASACLIGDSDICRLARALCRGTHPIATLAYRATTFWVGVMSLFASLAAFGFRAGPHGEKIRS